MKSKPINNPFAELDKIFNLTDEPTGSEWFTPKQYSEYSGIGYSTVTEMLRKKQKAKVLESWTGFSRATHKRVLKYRFVANKPAKG